MLWSITCLVVLAGAVCAWLLHRAVMGPIQKLHHRVRMFDKERDNAPVADSTPQPKDVIGDLNTSFNGMVEELDELYDDLEKRVEAKSRQLIQAERLSSVGYLAAGVAHEINNPLNAMMGYSELALKRLNDGAESAIEQDPVEALTIIRNEALRCKGITDKLLSLARKSESEMTVVHLPRVIDDVRTMVLGLRRLNSERLVVDLRGEERLIVRGVEEELKQVMLNLVINAIEATDSDEGQVMIRAMVVGGNVRLSISDNGKGIAPDTLSNVFEPFYTTKRGKGEGGTGLGLSIVYSIIKEHQGRITAHSPGLGQGSRFDILLPVLQEATR
jgi:signal transduction histidine kinase